VIGFVLFFLAGLVFGYAAPKAWAIVPILLPIAIGVYTGLTDVFDTELIVLMAVAVGVTILGIVLGRILQAATEGRQRTA
jgi:hypothetical protein